MRFAKTHTTVKRVTSCLPWKRHHEGLRSQMSSTFRNHAKFEFRKFYRIQYYRYVAKNSERRKHYKQPPSKNGRFNYSHGSTNMLSNRHHMTNAADPRQPSSSLLLMTQHDTPRPDDNGHETARTTTKRQNRSSNSNSKSFGK